MKMRKNVVIMVGIFLLLGFFYANAQQRFMMNQDEAHKFRIAKQMFTKGRDFMSKKKYKKAEKIFKECLQHFPKFSHADYALSQLYYQTGNYPLALEHIQKAKASYPHLAKLGANTELQYFDQLRTERQRLQEVNMEIDQALQRLSMSKMSAEARRQKEQELRIMKQQNLNTMAQIDERARKPVANTTDIPADFYYMHGNVFFKMKKYMDALKQYLETIRLDPAHGSAYNNLANLHFMARKYQKALYYLDKAESNGFKTNPKFRATIINAMNRR